MKTTMAIAAFLAGSTLALTSCTKNLQDAGRVKAPTLNTTAATPTLQAQLFQNCSYGGCTASFGTGSYNTAAIVANGGVNKDASSLKIPAGLKVTLYDGDNFTGNSLVLSADGSCLKNNSFNDKVSSLKVSTN